MNLPYDTGPRQQPRERRRAAGRGFFRGRLTAAPVALVFALISLWVEPSGPRMEGGADTPRVFEGGIKVYPVEPADLEVAESLDYRRLAVPGIIGLMAGGLVGALGGFLLGPTQLILARAFASAVVGLGCGLWYHALWNPLVLRQVAAEYVAPTELVLSGFAGLIGGGLWGLFQELIFEQGKGGPSVGLIAADTDVWQ